MPDSEQPHPENKHEFQRDKEIRIENKVLKNNNHNINENFKTEIHRFNEFIINTMISIKTEAR